MPKLLLHLRVIARFLQTGNSFRNIRSDSQPLSIDHSPQVVRLPVIPVHFIQKTKRPTIVLGGPPAIKAELCQKPLPDWRKAFSSPLQAAAPLCAEPPAPPVHFPAPQICAAAPQHGRHPRGIRVPSTHTNNRTGIWPAHSWRLRPLRRKLSPKGQMPPFLFPSAHCNKCPAEPVLLHCLIVCSSYSRSLSAVLRFLTLSEIPF